MIIEAGSKPCPQTPNSRSFCRLSRCVGRLGYCLFRELTLRQNPVVSTKTFMDHALWTLNLLSGTLFFFVYGGLFLGFRF